MKNTEIRIRNPEEKLLSMLNNEAKKEGFNVSMMAKRILLKHYKLIK